MFIQIKHMILLLFTLVITGCNDEMDIKFNRDIDLVKETEIELKNALKGIAVIEEIQWGDKLNNSSYNEKYPNTNKVRITFTADEQNQDYSPKQVANLITNTFSYQEQDITLTIDILERKEDILKLLSIEKEEQLTANLDWKHARTNVFYNEKETFNGSSFVNRDFFCAIQVPLKTEIPTLTYQYKYDKEELKGLQSFLSHLTFEAKHTKKLTGLPINDELFTIELETKYNNEAKYNKAFLIFENLGEKHNQTSLLGASSAPNGATKETCKELLRASANSNLFGVAGNVTAINNVISTTML